MLLPVIVFIVVISVPSEDSNVEKNKVVNYWIIARYLFFVLALIGCFISLLPNMTLWGIKLIPQRVDSKTKNKEIDEENEINEEEKDVIEPLNVNNQAADIKRDKTKLKRKI